MHFLLSLSFKSLVCLSILCFSTSSWSQVKRCAPGTVLVGFGQQNQMICEPLFKVLKSTDPKVFKKEILPWLDKQIAEFRSEEDDDFFSIKAEVDSSQHRLLSASLKPKQGKSNQDSPKQNSLIQKVGPHHYTINQEIFSKYDRSFWLRSVRLIPAYKAGQQVGFKVGVIQAPLDQFQLKQGDLITQVNSTPFTHKKALVSVLRTLMTQKKGTFVFTVIRDQKKHQLTLELIE